MIEWAMKGGIASSGMDQNLKKRIRRVSGKGGGRGTGNEQKGGGMRNIP